MPAVSRRQRRFFGLLEHHPDIAREKGIRMSREQMRDFATTKEKGLPEQAPSSKRGRKNYGQK